VNLADDARGFGVAEEGGDGVAQLVELFLRVDGAEDPDLRAVRPDRAEVIVPGVGGGAGVEHVAQAVDVAVGAVVAIEVDADEVWDVSDRAVPLALFMTETMSNALKHAFPQGRQGVIRIVLKAGQESMVRFSVEDNGVGLTEAQTAAQGPQASLGMSLIKAFARQVDGKLTISGPPGTVVSIEFLNKYQPHDVPSDAVRKYAWAV